MPAGRRNRTSGAGVLSTDSAETKRERHDHPDADEHDENPEQESLLSDRKPGQLALFEEELAPATSDALCGAVDQLTSDGSLRLLGHSAVRVEESGGGRPTSRRAAFLRGHARSLAPQEPAQSRGRRQASRKWRAGLLAIACAAALAVPAAGVPAASAPAPYELEVGDRFWVNGASIGCRIARIDELGGRTVVDCRRAGALAGTYGAMLSSREALIVQFRDARAAKVVYEARHQAGARQCR
jgi:hypothetical protein